MDRSLYPLQRNFISRAVPVIVSTRAIRVADDGYLQILFTRVAPSFAFMMGENGARIKWFFCSCSNGENYSLETISFYAPRKQTRKTNFYIFFSGLNIRRILLSETLSELLAICALDVASKKMVDLEFVVLKFEFYLNSRSALWLFKKYPRIKNSLFISKKYKYRKCSGFNFLSLRIT